MSDEILSGLPSRQSPRFNEALEELQRFLKAFATDEELRRSAVRLYAASRVRTSGELGDELRLLWGAQRGYPSFHPAWLSFLSEPVLTPFGEFVRECAREDPVIWGLWQDILFGQVGVACRVMGRRRVDEFIDGVRRGTTVRLWPEARQQAVELLIYLFLHPMCRTAVPPSDWHGPYAEIRDGFPEVVGGAPQAVGATKKVAYFLAAAVPWKSHGGRAPARCKSWVDQAVTAGLLSLTGPPKSRTWQDPRTDECTRIAAHRARWVDEHATLDPTGPLSRSVPPTRALRSARNDLIRSFLGVQASSAATLSAAGVAPTTAAALLLTDDPELLALGLIDARKGVVSRKSRRVVAAVLVELGESESSAARRLGVPPKAVRGWVRDVSGSPELRDLVLQLATKIRCAAR